jgi:hypothetical protein
LKPANEPIVLARKPISESTIAENVLKHGTGGLNIDACRIETNDDTGRLGGTDPGIWNGKKQIQTETNSQGRFPANLILDEEAAKMLDLQSGVLTSGTLNGNEPSDTTAGIYGKYNQRSLNTIGDSGGASRFFYCAKSSQEERSRGLKGMDYKLKHDTPQNIIDKIIKHLKTNG